MDAKAASSHTHTIANITSLQAALDAKAASSHTHTIANITSLQAALDAKAASSHTHSYLPLTGGILTGTLTASGGITGSLNGNASTATRLQTARTISGVLFDGSADIVIPYLGLSGAPMPDNYYTSEKNTGTKWIDGGPIYKITVYIGELVHGPLMSFLVSVQNVTRVIHFEGFAQYTNSAMIPLPYISTDSSICIEMDVEFSLSNIILYIRQEMNWRGFMGYVTLWYTKIYNPT